MNMGITAFVKLCGFTVLRALGYPRLRFKLGQLNRRVKETFLQYFLVFAAIALVSCSSEPLPELSIDKVSIYTEPDANQNSAIAVDLVIIYDLELVKMLGQMSAAKYFASSSQLLLDNPTLLDIWHWELVPGQIVQDFTPPQEQGDAFAAYVFANYLTPGDHRVKVSPEGNVKILLLKNDLKNLTTYNTPDVRMGTTMTNIPRDAEIDSDEDTEIGKIKLGPANTPTQSYKKVYPSQPCGNIVAESPNLCPPQGNPISIITRPLSPPVPCGRSSTPNKVKVWRN